VFYDVPNFIRAELGTARSAAGCRFENNYFTEMCSGFEAGSYLRRIDFVYHSTLGLRVIIKKDLAVLYPGVLQPEARRRERESSLLTTYWSKSTLSSR